MVAPPTLFWLLTCLTSGGRLIQRQQLEFTATRMTMAKEGNTPFSEKKKSRLQALERRLQFPAALDTSTSVISSGQEADPTYARLCHSILKGPLASRLQLHGDKASNALVDNILRDLLKSNTKTIKDVDGTIEHKLLDKVVLLEYPMPRKGLAGKAYLQTRKNSCKRSHKQLSSSRQLRKLGLFSIPKTYQKYTLYAELHELWKDYIRRLLKDSSDATIQSRILVADLHGAIIGVVDSKVVSFIGVQGIMIRETENTFAIITSNDQLKVIPKSGSIFMLQFENLRVTLIGNNLQCRNLCFSKQKQKLKATVEL